MALPIKDEPRALPRHALPVLDELFDALDGVVAVDVDLERLARHRHLDDDLHPRTLALGGWRGERWACAALAHGTP